MKPFYKKIIITILLLTLLIAYTIIFNTATAWTLTLIVVPFLTIACLSIVFIDPLTIEPLDTNLHEGDEIIVTITKTKTFKSLTQCYLLCIDDGETIHHIHPEYTNGSTITFKFVSSMKRGKHNVSLSLYVTDIFGLVARPLAHQKHAFKIYPRRINENILKMILTELSIVKVLDQYGDRSYDVKALVDYQESMNYKSIHWKKSSSSDKTVAKIMETFQETPLVLNFVSIESRHFEPALALFYGLITSKQVPSWNKILINGKTINLLHDMDQFLDIKGSQLLESFEEAASLIVTPQFINFTKNTLQVVCESTQVMIYKGNELLQHMEVTLW